MSAQKLPEKVDRFDHRQKEPFWQKAWEEKGLFSPDMTGAKKPFYNLMMFPYPSAEGLHVGNFYTFVGVDVYGRYKRMQGFDIFEPIGLDGFGIHSENYALKVNRNPKEQALISQKNFYRQLRLTGNAYDWTRTVETYDPGYYKWTQWIFVQMFKHGLAYRKKSAVNFCPSCKTVLSDEQVINGRCERCKTLVEKKEMEQWFFAITKYAEKLLQNTFRESFNWSEKVKVGQRNWIGKKEGINITYKIKKSSHEIVCFTTTPVNFAATFIVLAPEHPLVIKITTKEKIHEVESYIDKVRKINPHERIATGREKTGVFTGSYCLNHVTGEEIPIWISDFVLMEVGTGAIQGCPGHDLRDFEFAKKFGLPIKRVVVGPDGDTSPIEKPEKVIESGMKGTMINSDFLNGLDFAQAMEKTMDYFEEKGWGQRVTTYKLRDWCISRQRYWGAPIPMISCPKCGWIPVPEDQLPVLLPDLKDWKPEGTGKGPLAKLAEFVKVKCPKCGGQAERETDVCDTFLDSSWYHLRYPSVRAEDAATKPFNQEITKKWLPVTSYIGGAEHTVLHLLYARFVSMVLHDLGYIDFDESYSRFYAHGLIIKDGAKMSKSRGNVVVPDEYIQAFGTDTLRTYLMFLGPFDLGGDFRDSGIAGMSKFVNRVWRLVNNCLKVAGSREQVVGEEKVTDLTRIMHKTIKEVTEDMENLRFNTAIAHIMEYVNEIANSKGQIAKITEENIRTLLLLLAPFMPHMTEELWSKLEIRNPKSEIKNYHSIHFHPWPRYDPTLLVEDEVTIVVQVNGKVRGTIRLKTQNSKLKTEVETLAKKSDKVSKFLVGKSLRRVIFVPGKLINFVV